MDEEVPEDFIQWCKDGRWVMKNYAALLEDYENKYIGVRNYLILGSDTNQMRLINKLQKKFGKENTYNIKIELIRKYNN